MAANQKTIGLQLYSMRCLFPQFSYRRRGNRPTWVGTLRPTDTSVVYTVKMVYCPPKPPQVWVVSPPLASGAPHRYSDQALCLYYPKDGCWDHTDYLAETIVLWTAEWLAFYEIWRVTKVWCGPAAPHPKKDRLKQRT